MGRYHESTSTSISGPSLCGRVALRESCYKSLIKGFKSLSFLLVEAFNWLFSTRPTYISIASWSESELFAEMVTSRRIFSRLASTEFRSPNRLLSNLFRLNDLFTQSWQRWSKHHMLLSTSDRIIDTSKPIGLALKKLSVENWSSSLTCMFLLLYKASKQLVSVDWIIL